MELVNEIAASKDKTKAKCLLDALPANDKSFSRLFSEAPFLPESAFKLLDDICCSDNNCGKDIRDGDPVHQGLGSLWSLILGRPNTRQAFLDIALRMGNGFLFGWFSLYRWIKVKTVGDKVKFKLKFTKEATKRTQPKPKQVVIPKPHVKPKPAHVKQKPPLLLKIVMMRKSVTQWRED
ncbi:hypothetical protein CTI12_AA351230 [Artemisia annua]|uniref:Uncharacterized protein n=1 Tax=Artemisia annua TaxID=35608 RepID=A0A2U1MR25_ARTAN|nr:hypothetical protein CTI12_AA351230 [Artemisia annua]